MIWKSKNLIQMIPNNKDYKKWRNFFIQSITLYIASYNCLPIDFYVIWWNGMFTTTKHTWYVLRKRKTKTKKKEKNLDESCKVQFNWKCFRLCLYLKLIMFSLKKHDFWYCYHRFYFSWIIMIWFLFLVSFCTRLT